MGGGGGRSEGEKEGKESGIDLTVDAAEPQVIREKVATQMWPVVSIDSRRYSRARPFLEEERKGKSRREEMALVCQKDRLTPPRPAFIVRGFSTVAGIN